MKIGIWMNFSNAEQNYTGIRNTRDHLLLVKLQKIQILFAHWLFITPRHIQNWNQRWANSDAETSLDIIWVVIANKQIYTFLSYQPVQPTGCSYRSVKPVGNSKRIYLRLAGKNFNRPVKFENNRPVKFSRKIYRSGNFWKITARENLVKLPPEKNRG